MYQTLDQLKKEIEAALKYLESGNLGETHKHMTRASTVLDIMIRRTSQGEDSKKQRVARTVEEVMKKHGW